MNDDGRTEAARSDTVAGRVDPAVSGASAPPEAPLRVRRRIGRRLALFSGGAAVVLAAAVFVAIVPVQRRAVEEAAAAHIGLLAEAVAATYEVKDARPPHDDNDAGTESAVPTGIEAEHVHRAADILRELKLAEGVAYVDVTDHDGVVKRSTRAERIGTREPVSRRLRDVHSGAELLVVSHAMPFTQSCVQCHAQQHDPVGVVRVAVTHDVAIARLDRFHLLFALAILLSFGVLVAVILLAAERLVARPLFKLARLMGRAEKGDFLVRARIATDDEIGAIGAAFNRMLRAITDMKAHDIERDAALQSAERELAIKAQLEELAARLQESNLALSRRVQGQELLMEAAHRLGSTLDRQALVDRLARLIHEKLDHRDYAIFLMTEGEDREAELKVATASGRLDHDDVRDVRLHVGEGITGLVAETGAPLLISDLANPPEHLREQQAGPRLQDGALLCVPMLHKGRVVGVLDFYGAKDAFDADDVALLQALGAQAAMAVVNADLYQQTLELSVTDTLTGLMNRRALNRILESELVRAQRFTTPLAVLMLDVDHFKQYNDRMGHLLGDEALKAVAQALADSVRKVDAVARFGGEEFCVILPRTDEHASLDVAEKLLKAVRALAVPGAESQPLGRMSISVGVAVYPDDMPPAFDGLSAQLVLDLADRAAFEAKRGGRDRVVSAADVTGRPRRPKVNEPKLTEPKLGRG